MTEQADNIKEKLNPQQYKAVTTIQGPVMILAGAGSGKTKVLVHRTANMIKEGIDPGSILAITFTNKAAKEMRERVQNLIGEQSKEVWLYTFHSFCSKILRQEVDNLKRYHKGFSIYDTDDCKKIIKEILKNKEKGLEAQYMDSVGDLAEKMSRLKWDKKFYSTISAMSRHGNEYQKNIMTLFEIFNEKLKRNNAMDFEDLLVETVKLFEQNKFVLNKYQDKFQYIMVDEYQDTNTIQYGLVRMLSSKYKNLCVVGDADQSIYGWRGADINNILDFKKDYPECNIIKLERNYRSTKEIVEAANNVIKHNKIREDKILITDKAGTPIFKENFKNDFEESEYIANLIKDCNKNFNVPYSDFAILYRTNSLSSKLETEFIKKAIPYSITGGIKILDRKEVKDILAYLKILTNPYDEYSLKRIINTPARGFGPATVKKAQEFAEAKEITLMDALLSEEIKTVMPKQEKEIEQFAVFFYNIISYVTPETSVATIIRELLKQTDYINKVYPKQPKRLANEKDENYKIKLKKAVKENQDADDNLHKLINIAEDYDETENNEHSLQEFLNNIMLISEQDDNEKSKEKSVKLLTLHSAKGLEFPYVIITGLEEGVLPFYRAIQEYSSPDQLEEERRLFYVGITRAKEKLILSTSEERYINGQKAQLKPSRFLNEL